MTNIHPFKGRADDPLDRAQFGLVALSTVSDLLSVSPARLANVDDDDLAILLDLIHREIEEAVQAMGEDRSGHRRTVG